MNAVGGNLLLAIWLLAFDTRGTYVVLFPSIPFGDADDYDLVARSLLAGKGLGAEQIGFIRPPLYPILVAICYALGGMAVVQFVQVVLGASTTTLIGLLARRFTVTRQGA